MHILLLSGGSGKRLWPLSNDSRSKQFLKLLKDDAGNYESMVQRVYRQIQEAGIQAEISILTNIAQRDSIKCQLGKKVNIIVEPERRDTFPAIALGCSYLYSKKHIDMNETVVILPVDPYTNEEYFQTLKLMEKAINAGEANLALMGICPTYPSDKYGYIIPQAKRRFENSYIYSVKEFKEKPARKVAEQLLREGAVWNGGVFAFKISYIADILENQAVEFDYDKMIENYGQLAKTSFDYAVVEKETSIAMLPYNGYWKDLGTWNTFTEEIRDETIGNVYMDEHSYNTTVINECGKPVVLLGVSNMVVAVSPDGILVSDKYQSGFLKTYVDQIENIPMFEEKIWGNYCIVDSQTIDETNVITKSITLNAGKYLDYKVHKKASSVWMITKGSGIAVLNGKKMLAEEGKVIEVQAGDRYGIKAITDMKMMEIQRNAEMEDINVEIIEYDWDSIAKEGECK